MYLTNTSLTNYESRVFVKVWRFSRFVHLLFFPSFFPSYQRQVLCVFDKFKFKIVSIEGF